MEETSGRGNRFFTVMSLRPCNHHILTLKDPSEDFLPNFPQGKNPSSLTQWRQTIVEEVKKTEKNLPLIRKMMETTFPLDLWPALKIEPEVIWISSLFKVKI